MLCTEEEVAKHNQEGDIWIILGNRDTGGRKVYDVTKYLKKHPGGHDILLKYGGRNADDLFELTGHSDKAREIMKAFLVGFIDKVVGEPMEDDATKTAAVVAVPAPTSTASIADPAPSQSLSTSRGWLGSFCACWTNVWAICPTSKVGCA